jgi:hypothetical protein
VGTTRVDMPNRKRKWAPEMPFGELNALYSPISIFSSVEDIETVLLILWFYLLSSSRYRFPRMDIGDLEQFLLLDRGYIETSFGDLSSVISISNDIQNLHASLEGFPLDPGHLREFSNHHPVQLFSGNIFYSADFKVKNGGQQRPEFAYGTLTCTTVTLRSTSENISRFPELWRSTGIGWKKICHRCFSLPQNPFWTLSTAGFEV